jgi:VWFA-related protein
MKRQLFAACVFFFAGAIFGQQIQEQALVINVEVPVRVFKGSTFVDSLTLDDFQVYENGKLQKLEAVYLIKKKSVERKEETRRFLPQTSRNFILLFEISEYTNKMGEAIDHFIENVFLPGDTLTIVSPVKTYKLKGQALEVRSRIDIANQLKGILRRDAMIGSTEYRDIVSDLEILAKALIANLSQGQDMLSDRIFENPAPERRDLGVDELLTQYSNSLERLERLRVVNQQQLVTFSNFLKNEEGQKYVFMFYQREFVPKIEPKLLYQYIELYQDRPDISHKINDIFEFFKRESSFNVDQVKKAYADASISIHFLFVTEPPKHSPGVRYQEQSEDIFSAFREIAQATGGLMESSANPVSLLKDAVEAAENYYLLYYSPVNYQKDGQFHSILVKAKGESMRVTHRAGYFAN